MSNVLCQRRFHFIIFNIKKFPNTHIVLDPGFDWQHPARQFKWFRFVEWRRSRECVNWIAWKEAGWNDLSGGDRNNLGRQECLSGHVQLESAILNLIKSACEYEWKQQSLSIRHLEQMPVLMEWLWKHFYSYSIDPFFQSICSICFSLLVTAGRYQSWLSELILFSSVSLLSSQSAREAGG